MLKNLVKLEVQIEGKVYSLLCDNDSPLPHIKEFLFQCGAYIAQIEANVKAQQEAKANITETIKTDEPPQA